MRIIELLCVARVMYVLFLVGFSEGICARDSEQNKESTDLLIISLDNDLFVAAKNNDRDFTGGISITYSTINDSKKTIAEKLTLGRIDLALGIDDESRDTRKISNIEFGTYGFTPNGNNNFMQAGDRPFSSLVYLAFHRIYETKLRDENFWSSSLSIGVLGWDVFEKGQSIVHELMHSKEVDGWDSQISDGGEITFRYQVAYHDFWKAKYTTNPFKTSYFASLGYITELGFAVSTRKGLVSSSSQRFTPELNTYSELASRTVASPYAGEESYFIAGIAIKLRAYNAFLQGQFLGNKYELNNNGVNNIIVDAWLGYTTSFSNRLKLSYLMRMQSSEIKYGEGNRNMMWGGFVVSWPTAFHGF